MPSPSSMYPFYHDSSPEHAAKLIVTLPPSTRSDNMGQSEAVETPPDNTPRPLPLPPTKPSTPLNTNATALSRSGTLSWQQRPSSRDSQTPRSRPRSPQIDDANSAAADQIDEGHDREQIALSLSRKDPSWFRQSADRGANSTAYGKSVEETQIDCEHESRSLPGMSRDSSTEPVKLPLSASSRERSRSRSQASSTPDIRSWENRFSSVSSQSIVGRDKPSISTKASQRFGALAEGLRVEHPGPKCTEISSSPGPLLRSRPTSPTKGLGGFVQSAMMKRSDSVNKRWSAQAAPGLSRGNSVASHRGGLGQIASTTSGPGSPPREQNASSLDSASSPTAKSRPTSSHSTSKVLHHVGPAIQFPPTSSNHTIPASSELSLTNIVPMFENASEEGDRKPKSPVLQPPEALPASPTKTMDPRRWSPTKASWLESALARPDSPKLTSTKPQTPSWMAELQKSRLSKEDPDIFKSPSSSFTVVSSTGLMRSPPPGSHTQSLSAGGLAEGFIPSSTQRVSAERSQNTITEGNPPSQNALSTEIDPPPTLPTKPSTSHGHHPETKTTAKAEEKEGSPVLGSTSDAKTQRPLKAKPQTPPKTGFRANLRPYQNISDDSSSREPEFKNFFGKLKRTETKNYVAPDELKDNILRGKAALNLTGGPQGAKRVDEFKESILQKKQSMKARAGIAQKNVSDGGRSVAPIQDSAKIPEALAKRNTLNKSTASLKSAFPAAISYVVPENPGSPSMNAGQRSVPLFQDRSLPTHKAAQSSVAASETYTVQQASESKEEGLPNTGEQALRSREEDSQVMNHEEAAQHVPNERLLPTFTGTMGANMDNRRSAKLANHLNPSLAGILLRGPPSTTSRRNASGDDVPPGNDSQSRSRAQGSEGFSASRLTHMTKARARGPKRRLPSEAAHSDQPQNTSSNPFQIEVPERAAQEVRPGSPNQHAVSEDVSHLSNNLSENEGTQAHADPIKNIGTVAPPSAPNKKLNLPGSEDPHGQGTNSAQLSKTDGKAKAQPLVVSKLPTLRKISSPPLNRGGALPVKPEQKPVASWGKTPMRNMPDTQDAQEEICNSAVSVSPPVDMRQRKSSASAGSTSPAKPARSLRRDLPQPQPDVVADVPSTSVYKPSLRGLGLQLFSQDLHPPASQLTPPPENRSSETFDFQGTSTRVQVKDTSEIPDLVALQHRGPEVADFLTDFFSTKPKIADKAEVDAQAIILNRPNGNGKRKVLKTQMWQINADGKKESLPPQQGHILFEDCMYLCVHSFEAPNGSPTTEVYLWGGDGVSEAAMEDAQLFCRREARENNAKLELLRQGKEPAKFFQALGGIVITRRSRTSSLYMLCGRRHLGHVAFDEVDLDVASLCSGFPYIVSARFGKLYLWKGKASGPDEVGCARLIGMDLGLTGEIEEVEEGEEPPGFVESLSDCSKSPISSRHWSGRSGSGQYGCRLFRVELEQSRGMSGFWTRRGSSPAKGLKANIQEIYPFCQRDLSSRFVFVLDAYFNTFV